MEIINKDQDTDVHEGVLPKACASISEMFMDIMNDIKNDYKESPQFIFAEKYDENFNRLINMIDKENHINVFKLLDSDVAMSMRDAHTATKSGIFILGHDLIRGYDLRTAVPAKVRIILNKGNLNEFIKDRFTSTEID